MDSNVIEVTLKQLKEQVDKIVLAVLGDPSDSQKPGHGIRLDRLEQTNKAQGKILWALVSVFSVVAGAVLLRFV